METIKYRVIKTRKQYADYCAKHEELTFSGNLSKHVKDELELLELLIQKWDTHHRVEVAETDPIQLLKYLMGEQKIKAKDLAALLNVSTGLVSDMLNYKKGLSKTAIRTIAAHFKMRQDLFNREYELKGVTSPSKPTINNITVGKSHVKTQTVKIVHSGPGRSVGAKSVQKRRKTVG